MKIVDIIPKRITILIDWELEELEMLSHILSNCVYEYSSDDPKSVKAKEFLENKLYPFLVTAKETVDNGA